MAKKTPDEQRADARKRHLKADCEDFSTKLKDAIKSKDWSEAVVQHEALGPVLVELAGGSNGDDA